MLGEGIWLLRVSCPDQGVGKVQLYRAWARQVIKLFCECAEMPNVAALSMLRHIKMAHTTEQMCRMPRIGIIAVKCDGPSNIQQASKV